MRLFDLPDSAEIEVRVVRLVRTEGPGGAAVEAREGPWEFHFSLCELLAEEQSMPEHGPSPEDWKPAATTLERVVPVAHKRRVAGLTVALSYLEIHEGGNGFLHFLMRQDRPTRRRAPTHPRLELRVRDGSGRPLETREDSSGSSMGPSYATLASHASLLVFGLPDSGDIDVEVVRVVELNEFGRPREKDPSWEGPWTFRFRV